MIMPSTPVGTQLASYVYGKTASRIMLKIED